MLTFVLLVLNAMFGLTMYAVYMGGLYWLVRNEKKAKTWPYHEYSFMLGKDLFLYPILAICPIVNLFVMADCALILLRVFSSTIDNFFTSSNERLNSFARNNPKKKKEVTTSVSDAISDYEKEVKDTVEEIYKELNEIPAT